MIGRILEWVRLTWTAIWELFLGFGPEMIAVYSDGKRIPVDLSGSWSPPERPPHLLVKLEWDGIVVWKRDGGGGY